ncbi:hypothetical protein J1N35_027535 [Gossypium stocksii]|uniref:Uncharacterized protein n=1 Tax=Gossypium stocksii TaxID=47602 RepID=A0A9D3VA30_9ROSI|nr:hypothetical protein J1N35_027535 [Gossypium stocksii]
MALKSFPLGRSSYSFIFIHPGLLFRSPLRRSSSSCFFFFQLNGINVTQILSFVAFLFCQNSILDGVDSEAAAQRLRGQAGTSVTVKLHRGNGSGSGSSIKEIKLPRELIRLSPISSTVIPHRTPDGRLIKTGYVKLLTFSQLKVMANKNCLCYNYAPEGQEMLQLFMLPLKKLKKNLVGKMCRMEVGKQQSMRIPVKALGFN